MSATPEKVLRRVRGAGHERSTEELARLSVRALLWWPGRRIGGESR